MKVDFHCHTKAIKDSESIRRNVNVDKFKEAIEKANVELLVITNHNSFDLSQYNEFSKAVEGQCMVWPGIELDVIGNSGTPGHLVLISNPDQVEEFNEIVISMIGDEDVNKFKIEASEVIRLFKDIDIVYSPHHLKSKPMTQQDIIDMQNEIENKNRLVCEPSSIHGVGVLNLHGYKGVLGSDSLQSWDNYHKSKLGSLKFNITSFENFCKLLDKDTNLMNDFISDSFNKKILVHGNFEKKLHPFEIPIYNDTNIIYGDKGSGKSEILKSLNDHFITNESIIPIFYSSSDKDDFYKKLLEIDWEKEISSFSEKTCAVNLVNISNFIDSTPKSIESYKRYYSEKSNNRKINKMKCLDIAQELLHNEQLLKTYELEYKKLSQFTTELTELTLYDDSLHAGLTKELTNLITLYETKMIEEFIVQKSNYLFDNFVTKIQELASQNTGAPTKPITTGFAEFSRNRFNLHSYVEEIKEELNKEIVIKTEEIGKIGSKGTGIVETKISYLNNNNMSSVPAISLQGKKTPLVTFNNALSNISYRSKENGLAENISSISHIIDENNFMSIEGFISIQKVFKIKDIDTEYTPSSGEKAILNLQYNLLSRQDGEVFLIDEPELSLGGKYIEEIIVPLINKLSSQNKIIVIATHNANLAVRTRPINSIYKTVDNNKYTTYAGSMFTNKVVNIEDSDDVLSWIDTSLDHLEGGEDAFDERMDLYDR